MYLYRAIGTYLEVLGGGRTQPIDGWRMGVFFWKVWDIMLFCVKFTVTFEDFHPCQKVCVCGGGGAWPLCLRFWPRFLRPCLTNWLLEPGDYWVSIQQPCPGWLLAVGLIDERHTVSESDAAHASERLKSACLNYTLCAGYCFIHKHRPFYVAWWDEPAWNRDGNWSMRAIFCGIGSGSPLVLLPKVDVIVCRK